MLNKGIINFCKVYLTMNVFIYIFVMHHFTAAKDNINGINLNCNLQLSNLWTNITIIVILK